MRRLSLNAKRKRPRRIESVPSKHQYVHLTTRPLMHVDIISRTKRITQTMRITYVSGVKKKMVYAASTDNIKRKLVGVARKIQANDLSDVLPFLIPPLEAE
eukprot:GEMP01117593.1.p1 GENE.GEMP01117593.1~~GEMP01117593.1.p1  ORF type:complete len:101 (+),score=5.86 GEMP01117593.1:121-423(+)